MKIIHKSYMYNFTLFENGKLRKTKLSEKGKFGVLSPIDRREASHRALAN